MKDGQFALVCDITWGRWPEIVRYAVTLSTCLVRQGMPIYFKELRYEVLLCNLILLVNFFYYICLIALSSKS